MQSRVRDLPSRVVVYLLLAACLFPEAGVSGCVAQAHRGAGGPAGGGADGRRAGAGAPPGREPRRCGSCLTCCAARPPLRAIAGTWWRGLLVCAIDGTIVTVPDSPANLARFTKGGGSHGGTGYPQVRLLALVACGTRTLIDAVFGPATSGETTYAARPAAPACGQGMIVLADRNFAAG